VTDITPEEQLAFEAVKENIESTLLEEKRSKTWQEWLSAKQAELGVEYKQGLEPSPTATSSPVGRSTTSNMPSSTTVPTILTTITTRE
jgi:hypothetical protein